MGTALVTPRRDIPAEETTLPSAHGRRRPKKALFRRERNNNEGERLSATIGKLTFIQDCFPSLSGKENKLLHNKVPSFFSKSKHDANLVSRPSECIAVPHAIAERETNTFMLDRCKDRLRHDSPCRSLPPWGFHQQSLRLTLSETLKYIGCFVYIRCRHLEGLKPSVVVAWIRGVDKSLILSGWQEHSFVSQPNMVVLYMLLREALANQTMTTLSCLRLEIMASLYMCYAYNGHEISYPLKPFLPEQSNNSNSKHDRLAFWGKCMSIINQQSNSLLLINRDVGYFQKIEDELRIFGRSLEKRA